MKATMSTAVIGVSPAQQSAPSAFSDGSDPGFSEVLSGVHTKQAQQGAVGSVRKEDASCAGSGEAPANPEADAAVVGTQQSPDNAQAEQAAEGSDAAERYGGEQSVQIDQYAQYRAVGVTLEEELNRLVIQLSDGDEDEEGKIIDALLKLLKEMQEKGEGGEAVSLAMQLLTAMLGGAETKTAELSVTVKNASAEITEISGAYRSETALAESGGFSEGTALAEEDFSEGAALSESGGSFREAADRQSGEPAAQTGFVSGPERETVNAAEPQTEQTAREPIDSETLEAKKRAQTAETFVRAAADEKTSDSSEKPEQSGRPERAEIPVRHVMTAQEQPAGEAGPKTAEQLLSDLLDKANRELGLTKAAFTEKPETAEERTEARLPQTEAETPDGEQPDSGGQSPRFSARELLFTPNHKDGRSELERILDDGKEEPRHFEPNAAVPRETVRTAELPRGTEPKTEAVPVERQLADELLARSKTVNGGRSEFTMVLNPESLGRITVRLVSAGGRVQVSIAAENDATRQLLESRSDQIGTALKSSGVELERYQVVSGREEAQLMQDSYDGSSKNPYGRREEPAEERQAEDGEDFLEILQQL